VGRSVFEVYRDVPKVQADVRRALSGEGFSATAEVNGLYFDVHYEPLLNEHGTVRGIVGVALNATDRIKAAEALRES
jgi:hypothetical protein